MSSSRLSAALAIVFAVATSILVSRPTMPTAHADPDPFADPRINIYNTVDGDLGKGGCNIGGNRNLEDAAQAYAQSENIADARATNYDGRTVAFKGSGDPQAAAINSAYRNGAGTFIQQCNSTNSAFKQYGVGFIRHGDRSVDVVTIVFGAPNPPPLPKPDPVLTPIYGQPLPDGTAPPAKAAPPPANVTPPVNPPPQPGTPTATVTRDVDLYDKINVPDGAGKIIGMLRKGQVVQVSSPCPADDWCVLRDPAGAAWGKYFRNN